MTANWLPFAKYLLCAGSCAQYSLNKYLFIYLFGYAGSELQDTGSSSLWHTGSLVAAYELIIVAYGI